MSNAVNAKEAAAARIHSTHDDSVNSANEPLSFAARIAESLQRCVRATDAAGFMFELTRLTEMASDGSDVSRTSTTVQKFCDAGGLITLLCLHSPIMASAEVACATLSSISALADTLQIQLAVGVLPIIQLMQLHGDNVNVVALACKALGKVCRCPTNKDIIRLIGGIPIITRIVERYKDVAVVMQHVCRCIQNFCLNDENVTPFLDAGVMELLLSALRGHIASASETEAMCCTVQSACLHSSEAREAFRTCGGIPLLVFVLAEHASVAAVMEDACAALQNVCRDQENTTAFAAAGGILRLMNVLHIHARNTVVVDIACGALSTICLNSRSRAMVSEAHGIHLLLDLLKEHKTTATALRSLCDAIRNLCHNNAADSSTFVADDGMKLLVDVLRHHLCNVEVLDALNGAIECVSEHVPSSFLRALGGYDMLLDVLNDHVSSPAIVEKVSYMIAYAARTQGDQEDFSEGGLLARLFHGLHTHLQEESVVRAVCVAVADLWDSGRFYDLETVAEGIDILLNALHRHAASPTVVSAVCHALATICTEIHQYSQQVIDYVEGSQLLPKLLFKYAAVPNTLVAVCELCCTLFEYSKNFFEREHGHPALLKALHLTPAADTHTVSALTKTFKEVGQMHCYIMHKHSVRELQEWMTTYSFHYKSASIVATLTEFLAGNCRAHHSECQIWLISNVSTVLDALRCHVTSCEVARSACSIVSALRNRGEGRNAFVCAGGVELLAEMLGVHMACHETQGLCNALQSVLGASNSLQGLQMYGGVFCAMEMLNRIHVSGTDLDLEFRVSVLLTNMGYLTA